MGVIKIPAANQNGDQDHSGEPRHDKSDDFQGMERVGFRWFVVLQNSFLGLYECVVGCQQGLRGFVRGHGVLLTAFIPAYDIENYNFDIVLSFIKRCPGLPV